MRLIWDKQEFCFTFEKVSLDSYKKYKKVYATLPSAVKPSWPINEPVPKASRFSPDLAPS